LARGAELRYDVKITEQVTFLTQAAKEVHHASESLRSCPLPPDSVRLLHDAAACYRDPAACAVRDPVLSPGGHAGRPDGAGSR
jgi:uncharacterized protein YqiB (DUF1249 family)